MSRGYPAGPANTAQIALDSTTPASAQAAGSVETLHALVMAHGILTGAFLTLACLAGVRAVLYRARTYAWLTLAAGAALFLQFTLAHPAVAGRLPVRWLLAPAAETLAGVALATAATGLICSVAARNPALHANARVAAVVAMGIIALNACALWLPHTATQLALLLAAGACASLALFSLRLRDVTPLATPLGFTALAACAQLLLRLDGVAMLLPQPAAAQWPHSKVEPEYLASALANLGALGLWLRYLGGERPSLPSPDPEPAATHATPPYDPAAETGAETAPARDPKQERLKDQASRTIETLGYLAHDLRAPLATIMGYVRLMRGNKAPARPDYLDAIERSVDYQLLLIDDVLDYTKAELAPLYLQPRDTDLPALLDAIASYARALVHSGRHQFALEAPELLPARVEVDGKRLQQVLLNLLSNAVKYSSQGTVRLLVQAEKIPDMPRWRMRFGVRDEGIGIEPADQDRIFDAFTQLEQTQGGAGLGLLISERIVESMGGTLAVDSAPGKGSEFSFAIELRETDGTLVASIAGTGPLDDSDASLARISLPPVAARLELAMLVRDGRLTDIEEWLSQAERAQPDYNHYYGEIRAALQALDLARLERLALGEPRDEPPAQPQDGNA